MSESVQEIDRRSNSYIAIDLETTGLDPKRDRIIEIGAVKIINGQIQERFSSFVDPGRRLDQKITGLTGITDDMVKGAPLAGDLIETVINFCEDMPLLGHHIIFDYSFLKRAAVNRGLDFEKSGIDTLVICRKFMPEGEKKNLKAASGYYGISVETSHRALADAETSHLLYQKIRNTRPKAHEEAFLSKPLIYKVKKEQPSSKKQKQGLRDLVKYHKISLNVQIDSLTRNEVSRITDQIILNYGRIKR